MLVLLTGCANKNSRFAEWTKKWDYLSDQGFFILVEHRTESLSSLVKEVGNYSGQDINSYKPADGANTFFIYKNEGSVLANGIVMNPIDVDFRKEFNAKKIGECPLNSNLYGTTGLMVSAAKIYELDNRQLCLISASGNMSEVSLLIMVFDRKN